MVIVGGSEQNVLSENTHYCIARIVYEKSTTMWTVKSVWILFCFAFCSWENKLFLDLPGAADKERRGGVFSPLASNVQHVCWVSC